MPDNLTSLEVEECERPFETTFDVTVASQDTTFLGFLCKNAKPNNELEGLFSWKCRACGSANRAITIIKPQQAFLTRWTCRYCAQATIARFRARATADWIAQHTFATTGKVFCDLAEDDVAAMNDSGGNKRAGTRGQKAFAWLAIPALLGIILLGLSDWRRLGLGSALGAKEVTIETVSSPSTRLEGYWLNEAQGLVLCFGRIDPIQQTGTYVLMSRKPDTRAEAQFEITDEDRNGEQLIIRELNDGTAPADTTTPREATLYVGKDNQTMMWVSIRDGRPLITNFHRAGETRLP